MLSRPGRSQPKPFAERLLSRCTPTSSRHCQAEYGQSFPARLPRAHALQWAGLNVQGGAINVEDCEISGCQTEGFGGGVRIRGGEVNLTRVNIYNNRAASAVRYASAPSNAPQLLL